MTGKKSTYFSQVKQLGVLTTVPIILLAGPAVGYFIGSWIDRKTQLYPWFTIVFILCGFAAAAREVYRLLRQVARESDED